MIKKYWIGIGLLATLWGASAAMAQVGAPAAAAPPAAAPGAPAAASAAPAAAAAAPGFFQRLCDACDRCRRKLCKTPAGQMLNSMTAPASTLTGGIIPSFCPIVPSAADLAQPGVAGAADMAKLDALEAKARRAAVRYLGTLDCRYYPEAEAALISALRADRVECVRLEAAIALANGCCCTRRVMEALEICVSGSERDGNPAERSERVRDIAFIALSKCVSCFREGPVEVLVPEEPKDIRERPPVERKVEEIRPNVTKADKELIERSRKTLAQYQARHDGTSASAATAQSTVLPKGQRTLYHIIKYGTEGTASPTQPIMKPASRIVNPPTAPEPALGPMPRELPQVKITDEATPMPQVKATSTTEEPRSVSVKPPMMNEAVAFDATKPPVQPLAAPEVTPMLAAAVVPPTTSTSAVEANKVKNGDDQVGGLIDRALSGSPNERHEAIRGLSTYEWQKSPKIVAAMVKMARVDSDRAVRVNAIRHIASMKMDLQYVHDHLKYIQKDRDEWIAQEAKIAEEKLQSGN